MSGDLFCSKAQVLVNPVNCVGVMGGGLAKQFKLHYPQMFKDYEIICQQKELKTGKVILLNSENKKILLFPTKEHWKNPSKLSYIESGLNDLLRKIKVWDIDSIAFAKIGCGLGGLNWENDVKPLMIKKLTELSIKVEIWE